MKSILEYLNESRKSISFPKNEYKDIEERLLDNKQVTTVRVGRDNNKFKVGDILNTFNNHEIIITNVEKIDSIEKYKFYNFLNDEQKEYLSKFDKLDIIDFRLNKPIRKRSEIYILKDNKILFGIPTKEYSTYIIPGGKIENNETPDLAAKREAKEELGIIVDNIKFLNKKLIKYSGSSNNPYIQKNIERYSGVEIYTYVGYFKDQIKVNTNQMDVYKTIEMTKEEAIKDFTKQLKLEQEDFNKQKMKYVLECLEKL